MASSTNGTHESSLMIVGETYDHVFDWAAVLGTDTISGSSWTVSADLTLGNVSFTNTTSTVWVTAASDAGFDKGLAENTITTNDGRTYIRRLSIPIKD